MKSFSFYIYFEVVQTLKETVLNVLESMDIALFCPTYFG